MHDIHMSRDFIENNVCVMRQCLVPAGTHAHAFVCLQHLGNIHCRDPMHIGISNMRILHTNTEAYHMQDINEFQVCSIRGTKFPTFKYVCLPL
jgi:hypothetical protein